MSHDSLNELKAYVGFGELDSGNVRALAPAAMPLIPRVVDRFYAVLTEHPSARAVLDGQEQIGRLKESLSRWLEQLFSGPHDQTYFLSRSHVGHAHVRVGLPQRFMPLAMEVVRAELRKGLTAAEVPDIEEKLESLQKLLTLDLTIMLGSYHERHAQQTRDFERRALEGKLAHAQHLAEIGQLAASLAHEIKNPLAGISGAIQIIGESFSADSPYKSIVRDILAQISRLDATVKDLLLYARPATPTRATVKLGELIPRLIGVMREEPSLRNVEVRFDDALAAVEADEAQLEQLMMNLILNAAHASDDGAAIEIETRERRGRIALIVRDHGSGMSVQTRERSLEPFFTTKAKGTGLGLAICRRIAEEHGGSIIIDSEPDRGTTVTVELPQREAFAETEEEIWPYVS